MKQIALVTNSKQPQLVGGDHLLVKPFERLGYQVTVVPWKSTNLSRDTFVIIRSTWDYHTHVTEFTQWLDELERNHVHVWNPIATIRRNMRKTYLLKLEKKGIPIIPSIFITQTNRQLLVEFLNQYATNDLIIKPMIGAMAHDVHKISREDSNQVNQTINRLVATGGALIQPFMPEIYAHGELSLLFFNKKFSHAVIKQPKQGDFRVNYAFGGSINHLAPSQDVIQQAEQVVRCITSPLLYARVDGIVSNGVFKLMELELIEPYLYLENHPQATNNFMNAFTQLTLRS